MGCGASKSGTTITQKDGNVGNPQAEVDGNSGLNARRIVILGKTGTGKSKLCNAILGHEKFKTGGLPIESTTVSCEVGEVKTGDKNIVVLDTPGAMVTTCREQEKILEEILKGISSLKPGPHCVLLLMRADVKFTEEESKAVKIFCDFFGEEIFKHLIVVFTHKSALDKNNKTAEDCLLKFPTDFLDKYRQFNGCCIAIETEGTKKHVKKEVAELLHLVEMMVRKNEICFPYERIKESAKAYMARISEAQRKVEKQSEQNKGETAKDTAKAEASSNKTLTERAREVVTEGASMGAGLLFDVGVKYVKGVTNTLKQLA